MLSPLVITVVGPDKPGLVDAVAEAVASQGGNWLESRMCRLGGQFAGVLRIEVDSDKSEAVSHAISQVAGLEIVIHESDEVEESVCSEVAEVEVVGQDRPGIVSQIAKAFADQGVNVEELSTECRSAPMSGERLFEAKARVCIPESCDVDELRERIEQIAADLMVEVNFDSVRA